MAHIISQPKDLQLYFDGVVQRAHCHAPSVEYIIYPLLGGILWKTTGDIVVRTRLGSTANMVWVTFGHRRICFAYNYLTGQVEARERTLNGKTLNVFDNSTPLSDIRLFFEQF